MSPVTVSSTWRCGRAETSRSTPTTPWKTSASVSGRPSGRPWATRKESAGANVHVNLAYGDNLHHIIEAIFKAFGRALDEATQFDPRVEGVLSTKGKLE
jgi:hypothetical protein